SILSVIHVVFCLQSFFLTDPASSEIYSLSLHDALPIFLGLGRILEPVRQPFRIGDRHDSIKPRVLLHVLVDEEGLRDRRRIGEADRKSTRLNSSHVKISYAVFCLKKKKNIDSKIIYVER